MQGRSQALANSRLADLGDNVLYRVRSQTLSRSENLVIRKNIANAQKSKASLQVGQSVIVRTRLRSGFCKWAGNHIEAKWGLTAFLVLIVISYQPEDHDDLFNFAVGSLDYAAVYGHGSVGIHIRELQ